MAAEIENVQVVASLVKVPGFAERFAPVVRQAMDHDDGLMAGSWDPRKVSPSPVRKLTSW